MGEINLNSLKIFLEVASSNSFLEASNKLYISQPAISRSMSKLEEDLGIQLFYRANKGISLTPSGEVLFKYLRDTKDLLQSCERVLISMNDVEEGNIVIGVQSHIVRNYLMDKIDNFRLNHPKIKIQLTDLSTNALLEKLATRKIDFIVDASPVETIYNNINIKPIKELNTCFVKSVNNSNNITCLKDLEKEKIILPSKKGSLRKNLNRCFDENSCDITPMLEFDTEELIIDAVRRNLGVGYVVKSAIQYLVDANILDYVDINEDLPKMEINLVYIDTNLTKVANMFIKEEILNEE